MESLGLRIFVLHLLCAGSLGSRDDGEPFLLVADNILDSIFQVNATSGSRFQLPLGGPRFPISVDYDPTTDFVYWSDRLDRHIKRARRDGSGMETIVTNDVYAAYGLALDHAGGNVYWTDSTASTVSVARMDGTFARSLLTSPAVDRPGGLVLDPRNGYMYWTDWGIDARIDRAAMDGSNQTTIISNLTDPNMITIDYKENRLYYSDGYAYSIYSSDLLGNDIRRLFYEDGNYLFGIGIDDDNIYWTSWTNDQILMLPRSNLEQNETVLVDGLGTPNDIYVSGESLVDVTNGCSQSNGGCQDLCLARPGGRTCACRALWELHQDGMNCLPPDLVSPSYLWLDHSYRTGVTSVKMTPGNGSVIRELDEEGRNLPVTVLFSSAAPSRIEAIDYDFQRNLIFWVDTGLREIHTVDIHDSKIQSFTTLFEGISSGVEGLAVDWLNQNLYYTDPYFNWIGVVSYKYIPARHHVIVHEGLSRPRGIAVHPLRGYLFWSERSTSTIERSALSGQQRNKIVIVDIQFPSGLVINGDRLFWADTFRDRIESCDLNGDNREVFFTYFGTHFYDITTDGVSIAATDWADDSINFLYGGETSGSFLHYGDGTVYGVEYFDQSRQPPGQTECQVDNGGCNHTCVGDPDGHRCLCLLNFHLAEDNHTCIANEHQFSKAVFVGSDSGILQLPHNFLDLPEAGDWTDSYIVRGTKAFAMDFDYAGKMLFYTQQQNDGTQTIERFLFIGEGSSMTVFQNGQGIEGIAVDWVASNLYWTERQLGRIHVSKLDGSLRKVLMSGLDQPSAIAVHPEQSYVFWTEVGANPKISRASPDGSNKMVLVSSQTNDLTGSPTALAIDYNEERLYWVTTNPGSVESCNFDGWYVRTLRSADNADLFGVAFYKDYALWTDNSNQTLTFGRAYSGETHHDSRTVALSTAAYNIKVYDDTEQMLHTSACDQRNGGCMELCLPLENSRVCACGEGRYLQADAVSCSHVRPANIPTTPPPTVRSSGEDFLLVADYDTGYISEVNVTSGSNVTLPLHSTSPLALDYDSRTGYVYWSDYYDEIIYRAKRDGSGFETLVDNTQVSVSAINGLALDYAGQNIYWTDYWTEIIGVAKMDGRHAQAIVSENLNWPGDIVLDPTEGYMYWTDESFWTPRIERAAMDGSDRTVIVDTDLDSPVGITIDLIERRLYWCDSWLYNIQSSDLDGNNRQTLLSRSYGRFYGLSLNAHELFWTSSSDSYIGANSKSEYDQTTSRVVADGFSSLRGIAMYSPDVATDVSNACSVSNGGCQDVCLARPGGRTCACRAYFHLQSDNATCAPPEIKSPSFLWINEVDGKTLLTALEANSSIVRSPDFQSLPLTTVMAARPPSIIVSLDYDIRQGLIFWIDIGMKEIQQVDVRTGMVTTLLTAISAGAEALATDWINQNLYYTDFNYNRITMVSYGLGSSSGNSHIIAETGLDKPRGIAVDPSAGYVFWSDWGQSPKIERSTLSGEDRTAIVESDLGRPSGLVIDHATSKLYFADTERDTIDSCDFDGNNRQQFYSLPGTHFYDITFDGEEILASDWSDTTINFIHDSRPLTFVRPRGQNIMAVEFFHESRQPQSQSDCQVNNGGCQHTCVGDQSGHKCLCLADYSLAQDQQTCVKNDHLFTKALLVSTDEGILQFPHNLADLPGTADSKPTALVRGGKTVAMDFNYNEKAIYYTKEMDDGTQTIQKYDLTTNSSLTIYTGGQGIEGLAVDWVAANIYWTERNSGTISVARLDGSFRKVLLSGLVQPRGVAVHPEQRLLYWTETGRIVRSTLAGTDKEVIVSSQSDESIQNPAGISFDLLNSWVYWADSGAGTVMASDLRGEDPELRWTSNGGELFGIAVYKDFNFWTDRTNKTVSIGLRSTLRKVVQLQTTPHSVRVFDGSEQPLSRGPCDLQNGGCNELCLPTASNSKICACGEGRSLRPDGLTCFNPANPPTTTTAVTTTAAKPAPTTVAKTTKVTKPMPATTCTRDTLPAVSNGEFGSCPVIANVMTCRVVCRPNFKPTVSSINCLPSGNWNKSTEFACARVAAPEAVSIDVSFRIPAVPCTNDASTLDSARNSLISNFKRRGICETASRSNVDVCNADQMTVSCSDSSTRKRRELEDGLPANPQLQQLLLPLLEDSPNTSRLSESSYKRILEKQAMPQYNQAYGKKQSVGLSEKSLATSLTMGNSEDVVMHLVKKDAAVKDRIWSNRAKRASSGLDVNIAVKAIPDTSDRSLEDSISQTQAHVQDVVDEIKMEVAAGNVAVEVDGQTYRADPDSFTAMAVKYECPSGTVEIDGGCGSVPRKGRSNTAAVAVGVVVALLLLGAISLGGYMYYRRKQRTYPGQNVRLKDLETQENPAFGMNDTHPYNTGLAEGADGGFLDLTKAHPENVVQIEALPEKLAPSAPGWEGFDDGKLSKETTAQAEEHAIPYPSAPVVGEGVNNFAPSAPIASDGVIILPEEEKKVPVASWEIFDEGKPASEAPPVYENVNRDLGAPSVQGDTAFDDGKPVSEAVSSPVYENVLHDLGAPSAQDDIAPPTDWEIFDDDKLEKEATEQQEPETQPLDDYTQPGGISNPMYGSKGEGNA
ncbi:low-density lipoprotein receptor-related protein 2-like isoform X1 [Branchiostoma floridae x Branchiostoma belcheri]